MDIQLDTLPYLLTVLPYVVVGGIFMFLASALLVTSPAVFLPNIGIVSEDFLRKERRKAAFFLIFAVGVMFVAAGWWSFTEAGANLASLTSSLNEGV